MWRQWYQWGAKSSKTGVKGGGTSSAAVKPEPPPPPQVVAAGCMGVVSHLFDFHHLHHPDHHQSPFDSSQPQYSLSSRNGFEAPRNSLETEALVVATSASLASISEAEQEGDENLYIPLGVQINTGRSDTRLLRSQSPSPKLVYPNNFSFSEPDNSNTPVAMGIQINTSRRDTKLLRVRAPRPETGEKQSNSHSSTESTISPAGPRTPTLVARLMGLDLLPEGEGYPSSSSCTPRSSITTPHRPPSHSVTPKRKKNNSPRISVNGGTYDCSGSLMETPRLSLQINKENRGAKEGFVELSRHSCSEINTKRRDLNWKGGEEESMISRSPRYYARQIMKQVKESVMRRKFGADITNKTGEVQSREHRKDGKRPHTAHVDSNDVVAAKEEIARNSVSPLSPIREQKEDHVKVEPMEIVKPEKRQEKAVKPDWRTRNPVLEKKGANPSAKRSPLMNKKEEQFVRADAVATTRANQGSEKKCKTTPLSSELLHGNGVPSLGRLKKSDPSIAATGYRKVVQGQNKKELSEPRPPTPPVPALARSSAAPAAAIRSEFNYISQILKRAGINRDTPVSTFIRWFSPSHPLDPSLFHFLEADHRPAAAGADELSPPCNRRLMFDLVDEILAHIMRPHKVGRTGGGPHGWARMHGFQVTRMVWARVKEFPRADCKILQDIDELVEVDLSGQGSGSGMDADFVAGEEEEDDIVAVIEREIVEALLVDTAVAVGGGDNGYFLTGRPY